MPPEGLSRWRAIRLPRYLLSPLAAVACLDAGMSLGWGVALPRACRVIGGILCIGALTVLKRVRQAVCRVGDGLATWLWNVGSGLATRVRAGIGAIAVGRVLELAHRPPMSPSWCFTNRHGQRERPVHRPRQRRYKPR